MNEITCKNCNKVVPVLHDNMCEECYDDVYSGCYGGGCIGGEETNSKD